MLMPAVVLTAGVVALAVLPAQAAPAGKASAAFDNARPDKGETAWGRLAADAVRSAARADVALLNAGAFNRGTLPAGPVEAAGVNALLAFPDDDMVVLTLSGAQLRAALEYAVKDYPTASPRFLHTAGLSATFDARAPANSRLVRLRVAGREVADADSFAVAMPRGLAQGGAGFYTVWSEAQAKAARRAGVSVSAAVINFVTARGEIVPDEKARLAPQ